jgi:hypothetical protein
MAFTAIGDHAADSTVEAVRLYNKGAVFLEAAKHGVTERQMSVMSGMSLVVIREAAKVAEMYPSVSDFLDAYNQHPVQEGSLGRSWASFLTYLGINALTTKQADEVLSSVKASVGRLVLAANASADPALAQETLGKLRAWIGTRVPPTNWATVDTNYFQYSPCTYCADTDPVDPEIVKVDGLLSTMCYNCRAEGVAKESVNYGILARTYAAYAQECNSTAELYRTI